MTKLRTGSGAAIIAAMLASASITGWLGDPDTLAFPIRIDEGTLASIAGANPGARSISGGSYCSGQNLEGTQLAAYQCPGNPGATCVICVGSSFGSGIARVPVVSIQPSGGANDSCDALEKWYGTCDSNNGNYICRATIDSTVTCTGDYPPYNSQSSLPVR